LKSSELLTEEQVQYLLQRDDAIDSSSNEKLQKLTGFQRVRK